MRKIYLLAIAMFATLQATTLMAQEEVLVYQNSSGLIPGRLTTDNNPLFYAGMYYGSSNPSSKYQESLVSVYDTDFNVVRKFTVCSQALSKKNRIEEREGVPGARISYENEYDTDIISRYEEFSDKQVDRNKITIDDLVEMWKYLCYSEGYIRKDPAAFTLKSTTDSTAIFYPQDSSYCYYPKKYGTKYPYNIITLSLTAPNAMHVKEISYHEKTLYTGDWKVTEEGEDTLYTAPYPFSFITVDKDYSDVWLHLSQTLFNDDEKLEYLMPVYGESYEPYSERDRDYDGEIDYVEYRTHTSIKGYNIYSEEELICYLNIPICIEDLYLIGGNIYIAGYYMPVKGGITPSTYAVYRLNKSTNSVEQVTELVRAKMSVRKDIVSIDFKEAVKEGCELIVTASDGRLCEKSAIAAGSENVKYDTRALSSGIYNFTVMQNGKAIESGKIIVR